MKKLLSLVLAAAFITMAFTACGGPEITADASCEVLYNLYIKQDVTNTDKLGISADESKEILDLMNKTAADTFIANATGNGTNGLAVTDEQAAQVAQAIYIAQKKLTPKFELVSSDKKTAVVKITTNYIEQTTIDTDAATQAVEAVNALGLTDENEWAKKVVEEYISRLVDGLNNAQPSAETREMTVEMSVTDGVWLPTNMETFATNLSSSVAA